METLVAVPWIPPPLSFLSHPAPLSRSSPPFLLSRRIPLPGLLRLLDSPARFFTGNASSRLFLSIFRPVLRFLRLSAACTVSAASVSLSYPSVARVFFSADFKIRLWAYVAFSGLASVREQTSAVAGFVSGPGIPPAEVRAKLA